MHRIGSPDNKFKYPHWFAATKLTKWWKCVIWIHCVHSFLDVMKNNGISFISRFFSHCYICLDIWFFNIDFFVDECVISKWKSRSLTNSKPLILINERLCDDLHFKGESAKISIKKGVTFIQPIWYKFHRKKEIESEECMHLIRQIRNNNDMHGSNKPDLISTKMHPNLYFVYIALIHSTTETRTNPLTHANSRDERDYNLNSDTHTRACKILLLINKTEQRIRVNRKKIISKVYAAYMNAEMWRHQNETSNCINVIFISCPCWWHGIRYCLRRLLCILVRMRAQSPWSVFLEAGEYVQ